MLNGYCFYFLLGISFLVMAERNGSNRTQGGLELEAKHQSTYEKWWLGKCIETEYFKNYPESDEKIKGIVEKVEYIGNSMVGVVNLTLDSGFVYLVGGANNGFRPKKSDVKVLFNCV
jgi:hypothetical protein